MRGCQVKAQLRVYKIAFSYFQVLIALLDAYFVEFALSVLVFHPY